MSLVSPLSETVSAVASYCRTERQPLLMMGYSLYGCLMQLKAQAPTKRSRVANSVLFTGKGGWFALQGVAVSLVCYTYASSIVHEWMFLPTTPTVLRHPGAIAMHVVCFIVAGRVGGIFADAVSQRPRVGGASERDRDDDSRDSSTGVVSPRVLLAAIQIVWLIDACRAAMAALERGLNHNGDTIPNLVSQVAVWFAAGPALRGWWERRAAVAAAVAPASCGPQKTVAGQAGAIGGPAAAFDSAARQLRDPPQAPLSDSSSSVSSLECGLAGEEEVDVLDEDRPDAHSKPSPPAPVGRRLRRRSPSADEQARNTVEYMFSQSINPPQFPALTIALVMLTHGLVVISSSATGIASFQRAWAPSPHSRRLLLDYSMVVCIIVAVGQHVVRLARRRQKARVE